jgi:hypothetical protein
LAIGLFGGLVVLLVLALPVLLVWALWDLLQRPAEVWVAAGQDRLIWALVVIFVALIGPVLYLVTARPRLDAADRKLRGVSAGIDES